MTVVFSASEIGSARALIPLVEYFSEHKICSYVVKRGYFNQLKSEQISSNLINCPENQEAIIRWLVKNRISIVIFSVNVADQQPLKIARAAEKLGIPTIHVLDYWNGYIDRMRLDGLKPFQATFYAVPDEYAANKAKQEGISTDSIKVTGQPAFSDALVSFNQAKKIARESMAKKLGLEATKKWLLFVAEPVQADQGHSLSENPKFRGYTEYDALFVLLQAMKKQDSHLYLCILPHPRQDLLQLKSLWHSMEGDSFGEVVPGIRGRDLLPFAVGVSGMASTLLYESWMVGMPVISIQPNLRVDSMRMMQERKNVTFIDKMDGAIEEVAGWLNGLSVELTECHLCDDAQRHELAAENIFKLLRNTLEIT